MKYKRRTMEEKRAIVLSFYANDRYWKKTAEDAGISEGLLRDWLADEAINPNREDAMMRKRGRKRRHRRPAMRDPFPCGVKMASGNNPGETRKENRDLRRKIAYLEDKVAYLTELYKVISEDPGNISKKNGSRHCRDSSDVGSGTRGGCVQ